MEVEEVFSRPLSSSPLWRNNQPALYLGHHFHLFSAQLARAASFPLSRLYFNLATHLAWPNSKLSSFYIETSSCANSEAPKMVFRASNSFNFNLELCSTSSSLSRLFRHSSPPLRASIVLTVIICSQLELAQTNLANIAN